LEIGIKYNLKYFINTDSYFNKDNLTYNALPNYSKTKKLFLSYLKDMGKDISIINMRLEHVYGPNDNSDKFITYLVKNMKLNKKIPLTFGHQKRDFVFVDDVAEVYNNIILNITKLPTPYFEDLEIGLGKSIHLRDFIEILSLKIKTESILDYGVIEYRDDEIMNSFANNSLSQWAKRFDINFNFMDVNEGIEKMLSYEYNQNLSK
jgi:nucleoside-diphosphate-sugar epimerase